MEHSDTTLNDGQPGYLCIMCDVFWPKHYFEASDLVAHKDRRICADHRARLKLVKHGYYTDRGGGAVFGCFEPGCASCAAKGRK